MDNALLQMVLAVTCWLFAWLLLCLLLVCCVVIVAAVIVCNQRLFFPAHFLEALLGSRTMTIGDSCILSGSLYSYFFEPQQPQAFPNFFLEEQAFSLASLTCLWSAVGSDN